MSRKRIETIDKEIALIKSKIAELEKEKEEALEREAKFDEKARQVFSNRLGKAILTVYGRDWKTFDATKLIADVAQHPSKYDMGSEATVSEMYHAVSQRTTRAIIKNSEH